MIRALSQSPLGGTVSLFEDLGGTGHTFEGLEVMYLHSPWIQILSSVTHMRHRTVPECYDKFRMDLSESQRTLEQF